MDLAEGSYGAGRPGYGQSGLVAIWYNETSAGRAVIQGPMGHARFGWSLTCLDFNLDGSPDLVISAPAASWNDTSPAGDAEPVSRQWGRLYVHFGGTAGLSPSADVVIHTEEDLTFFGDVLATGDLNGDGHEDLLVGTPFANTLASIHRGAVYGYLSSSSNVRGASISARPGAALYIAGPAEYDWFGQSITLAFLPQPSGPATRRLLIVGAPGHRVAARAPQVTVGAFYAYALDGPTTNLTVELLMTVTGAEHLAEFGHGVATSTSTPGLLAVSSPAAGTSGLSLRGGAVSLMLLDQDVLDKAAAAPGRALEVGTGIVPRTTLSGDSVDLRTGRFGYSVGFHHDVHRNSSDALLVGAPLASSGLQREAGYLFVFDAEKLPLGEIDDVYKAASWSAGGAASLGRFGFNAVATGGGRLAVASPHATNNAGEFAGLVQIFDSAV